MEMDLSRQSCIDSVMNSYKELGVVNLSDGYRVPARKKIIHILETVREVLFPGFFGSEALSSSDLATFSSKSIVNVIEMLAQEIEKSIDWFGKHRRIEFEKCAPPLDIAMAFVAYIPELRKLLKDDAQAIFDGDPAAKDITEVILAYPGFHSIIIYRVAHFLHQQCVPLIPRLMTEIGHSETGIDIHPGARIGRFFCIDHGTGIVIGETAVIGDYVKLYQGVTLGAFSVAKDNSSGQRHPTIGNNVTIYARSTILGGDTLIGDHSIIGGNVWLVTSVPAYSTLYVSPEYKHVIKPPKD
jgi:serine O-acetyltransferase